MRAISLSRPALALCAILPLLLVLPGCDGGDDDGGSCTRLELGETGPGDVSNHFPAAVGDGWTYQVTGAIEATVLVEATGTRTLDGDAWTVFTVTQVGSVDPPEEELVRKNLAGVTVRAAGAVEPPLDRLYPYVILRWPLAEGDAFNAVRCEGLRFEDVDGDGRGEKVDVTLDVSVGGDEAISVPAGEFTARRVSGHTVIRFRVSSGLTISAYLDTVDWYAPGVGLVRSTALTTGDLGMSSEEMQLTSYSVGGGPPG